MFHSTLSLVNSPAISYYNRELPNFDNLLELELQILIVLPECVPALVGPLSYVRKLLLQLLDLAFLIPHHRFQLLHLFPQFALDLKQTLGL